MGREPCKIYEKNKLVRLALIGNGVNIGTSCLIAHRVVIARYVQIGNFTKVWGNASIRDGVSVGINSVVGMGAVVIRNIPNNQTWIGIPAKKI